VLHLSVGWLRGAGLEWRRVAVAARYWLRWNWLGTVGVVVRLVGASVDVNGLAIWLDTLWRILLSTAVWRVIHARLIIRE